MMVLLVWHIVVVFFHIWNFLRVIFVNVAYLYVDSVSCYYCHVFYVYIYILCKISVQKLILFSVQKLILLSFGLIEKISQNG